MQIIANDSGRMLNSDEAGFIKQVFPKANVDKMKYLGPGGEFIKVTNSASSELCDVYTCLDKGSFTEVYFSVNGSYVGNIEAVFKTEICNKSEYECIDFNMFYVTYNCIGWALGISKWLNPSKVTNYIKNKGLTHQQAIEKFVIDVDKEYPSDHVSNLEGIVGKLHLENNIIVPFNNTVGFYFQGDDCLHGSRFVSSVNGNAIAQWSSKLGQEFLVSHDGGDLSYNESLYGDTIYYLGMSYDANDEL